MRAHVLRGVSLLLALCTANLAQRSEQNIPSGFGAIEGRVLDAEGKPMANAKVHAEPLDTVANGLVAYATSNAKGEFFLDRVAMGANMVFASKEQDGHPNTLFAVFATDLTGIPKVFVEEGEVTRGVVVRLGPKGGKLRGRITDSQTGLPVKTSRIRLSREDTPSLEFSTNPDEQGQFKFALPPRPFRIEVVAEGYKKWVSETILLPSGSKKELPVSLDPIKGN